MATYTTQYPGDTAKQGAVWTLSLREAEAALALLSAPKGSYWEGILLKPMRRAVRAKAQIVRVYTADFFRSSELSTALFNTNMPVERVA